MTVRAVSYRKTRNKMLMTIEEVCTMSQDDVSGPPNVESSELFPQ